MGDPYEALAAVSLDTACQIVSVEKRKGGCIVDVLTLDACNIGRWRLPAGTPMALGINSWTMTEPQSRAGTLAAGWVRAADTVHVVVGYSLEGPMCSLSCRRDRLTYRAKPLQDLMG